MTDNKEYFSLDELLQIFQENDIEVEVTQFSFDSQDFVALDCAKEGMTFKSILSNDQDDQFVRMWLMALVPSIDRNPFEFANTWNRDLAISRARVFLEDDGSVSKTEEGDPWVAVDYHLFFNGGVSSAHVSYLLWLWCDDLSDMLGLEEDDAEDASEPVVLDGQVESMDTVDQLEWILSADSVPRTARQLAGFLMKERQEINRTLYANPEKFLNDGMQPPRWTKRSDSN
jgi:hypothetical protein